MDLSQEFNEAEKTILFWKDVKSFHPMLAEIHPFSSFACVKQSNENDENVNWPISWATRERPYAFPPPTAITLEQRSYKTKYTEPSIADSDRYQIYTLSTFLDILETHLQNHQTTKNNGALHVLNNVARPCVSALMHKFPNLKAVVAIDTFDNSNGEPKKKIQGIRNFSASSTAQSSNLQNFCQKMQQSISWTERGEKKKRRELSCVFGENEKLTNIGAMDIGFLSFMCRTNSHRKWADKRKQPVEQNGGEDETQYGDAFFKKHLKHSMYIYLYVDNELAPDQIIPVGCCLFNLQHPSREQIGKDEVLPQGSVAEVVKAVASKYVYNMELVCMSDFATNSKQISFANHIFAPCATLFLAYAWRFGDHEETSKRHTVPCITLQSGSDYVTPYWIKNLGCWRAEQCHLFLGSNPINRYDFLLPISFPDRQNRFVVEAVNGVLHRLNSTAIKPEVQKLCKRIILRTATDINFTSNPEKVAESVSNALFQRELPGTLGFEEMWALGFNGPVMPDGERASLQSLTVKYLNRMYSEEKNRLTQHKITRFMDGKPPYTYQLKLGDTSVGRVPRHGPSSGSLDIMIQESWMPRNECAKFVINDQGAFFISYKTPMGTEVHIVRDDVIVHTCTAGELSIPLMHADKIQYSPLGDPTLMALWFIFNR